METESEPAIERNVDQSWVLRISNVFDPLVPAVLDSLGARLMKRLGREYHLVKMEDPARWRDREAACFVRWCLPIGHSWPCSPRQTPGFVEKAARALERKFASAGPRTILLGALDPGGGGRYHQQLASNLRGRALQLFPPELSGIRDPEELDPDAPVLWGLVGNEGLFCGMRSPKLAGGFYPGGTRFISQSRPGVISRAGAKVAEAIHHLGLHRPVPLNGSSWLELGASPGGMTSELLARGFRVTAVDRAPLDPRLSSAPGLRFVQADAADFVAPPGEMYDALLSDMNGDARDSMAIVARMVPRLRGGALVVFTLKMPGVSTLESICSLRENVVSFAMRSGLRLLACTHLSYNRHEFTLFFEKQVALG